MKKLLLSLFGAAALLVAVWGAPQKAEAYTCIQECWPGGPCCIQQPDTPPGMLECNTNTNCNASFGEVLYFTGQNGTGWCAKTQGAANIPNFADFNDRVRSVKNCSGKMVDAYEHANYGGYHGTFGDAGNTAQNLNSDLDLKISSSKRRP